MSTENNDLGLIRLRIINKLMTMYVVGTGKKPNHQKKKGEFEIIDFIKESLKILKTMHNDEIYEISNEFIENFFITLLKEVVDE